MAQVTHICFVCLGNIVRSPLAENMFRHLAEQRGLGHKYQVDSAGTGSWHVGERPDARMRQVASRRGFQYDGSARQIIQDDLEQCDLIIAMDRDNRSMLERMAQNDEQRAKIHQLREFDPQGRPTDPVPDPYYGGIDGFERVYDIVERSCRGLLDALENGEMK